MNTRSLFAYFASALSLVLLPACTAGVNLGANAQQKPQANVKAPVPAATPASASESVTQVRDVFRGSVGDHAALMGLSRGPDGSVTGSYSYEGRGGELTLKGKIDEKGDFTLEEYDGAKQTGLFKGRWHEADYDPEATIYGDWSKPGGGGEQTFFFRRQPRVNAGGPAVAPRHIDEEDKRRGYRLSVTYPEALGAGFEGLNRLIMSEVNAEVADFKKEAGRKPGEKDYAPEAAPDSLDIDYVVRLDTPELFSAELRVDFYEHGAAHGAHSFRVVNYDVRANRRLGLADLFKPGSDYLKRISEVAIGQVRKWNRDSAQEPGSGGEPYLNDEGIAEGAAPKTENYQNWTLAPRGLVVTYDYYQLGPYAAGSQTVVVPYAELKEVLRPDGPVASLLK